ncbi:hypothetical protein DV735_g963, partial [Chaetothyriales sp. CBS 134920]
MNPPFSTPRPGSAQPSEFATNTYSRQASPSPGHASDGSQKQSAHITSNPTQEHGPFDFGSITHAYGSNHALDVNLLTPDYSDPFQSEHATPQELAWTQDLLSHDPSHFDMADMAGHKSNTSSMMVQVVSPPSTYNYTLSAHDQDLPQYISASQLLSPQLTTPSPPAPASRFLSQQSALMPQRSEGLSIQQALTPDALRLSQTGGYRMSNSPIVVVSTHHPGDSSAQPAAPRARSSSKRGREIHRTEESCAIEDEYFSERNAASYLMPPQPFEADSHANNSDDRAGLSPDHRGDELVTSINQLTEQRGLEERNAGVQEWLSKSETGSVAGDDPNDVAPHRVQRIDRPRAHTTGTRPNPVWLPTCSDHRIPGPGLLLNESSDDGYSYDDSTSLPGSEPVSESPPVSQTDLYQLNASTVEENLFPSFDTSFSAEPEEPLQSQFIRRTPWQDPIQGPITDRQSQPQSSNAAAWKFNQEAAKWESASRHATWGTGRQLTELEINAIVDGSRVRHLSLAKRSSSILTKARGLIPRRSNSNIKKAIASPAAVPEPEPATFRELASPRKESQRMGSFSKPKSPSLNTGSAFMAMSGNLAAIGSGHGGHFTLEPERLDGFRNRFNVLRKHRSKSDVSKSSTKGAPGLGGLMLSNAGTPIPKLASPLQEPWQLLPQEAANDATFDDEDDNVAEDTGVSMDLSIRAENIIPTFEGFKAHVQELNPRLEACLVDRLGYEQVRRYKRLLENKVNHTRATKVLKNCSSGPHCISLGGNSKLLPASVSANDAAAQLQVPSPGEGVVDETSLEEGVAVTPSQFPPGIPLPPVSRLPAEFECFLCYKVKKVQKPSDWTKHVHEDVQPFTCTFPDCNEVKTFKRKADWVRHESELHRRLEYWECSVLDCSHVCYRKDNFVQHLVREHKKAEPKTKSRGSGSSKTQAKASNSGQGSADEAFWRLVDSCRHESPRQAKEEPCRFCGNVCNDWKKLSVHLAKHMEQIAIPVLQLVNNKEVGPDFAISPIEQTYGAATATPSAPQTVYSADPQRISPHSLSASSRYRSASAGHSPAAMMPLMPTHAFNQTYRSPNLHPFSQADILQGASFDNGAWYINPSNGSHVPSNTPSPDMFVSVNDQLVTFPTSLQPSVFPSSVPVPVSVPDSQPMPSYAETQTPFILPDMAAYSQVLPTQLATQVDAIDHLGSYSFESQPKVYDEKQ